MVSGVHQAVAMALLAILGGFHPWQQPDPREQCAQRLKDLGQMCLLYAEEHGGRMPASLPTGNAWRAQMIQARESGVFGGGDRSCLRRCRGIQIILPNGKCQLFRLHISLRASRALLAMFLG